MPPSDDLLPRDDQSIELEPSQGKTIAHDTRRTMPEPPPVRLVSVADVHLPAAVGREAELDLLYVEVLGFVKQPSPGGTLAYAAENFSIVFDFLDPPIDRDAMPTTPIEVPSLTILQQILIDREIPHEWVKSLLPGTYAIVLQDPAGNWLSVGEARPIR